MSPQSTELNADHDSTGTRSSADEKHRPSFGIVDGSTRSSECERRDSRHHPLLPYEEIPEWYQDNPYVRKGYRPVSHSARACLGSWIYVHNETMNIYTHLVPAAALLVSGLTYIIARLRYRNSGDAGIVAVQMVSAVACLGFSSAYHTLMCHSHQVEALWLRFDFVGIILLILGSFISGIYVAFWCEVLERKIYWSMIGSFAAISIVIVLAPTFQGPRWRTLRLLTFVCTGLSGLAPIIHGICMFGFAQMMKQSGLAYYFAEGGLFLLGAVIYATRFPESISPGTFDIYGSSHQIFHILVVLATAVHLAGVLDALDYNYYNRQCMPRG
ncbi:mPR-like GPCR protein [Annulohypoxylon bovei var. microspora]|nr:mPR-like GPCR protein [Annulohypoxylon bovei var. microspora]